MKKIHWFTIPNTINSNEQTISITESEITRQIFKVLKLDAGELIVVRTKNGAFDCTIASVSKHEIEIRDLKKRENTTPIKNLTLLFCIPKKDKFELILEKCTELGVTDFYPIISDRTIKTNINFERSLKIIEEASEQAQRTDTPILHPIVTLDEILKDKTPIVFDVDGIQISKDLLEKNMMFLIGPEGGFSDKELALFKEKELEVCKIGNTILKTETAAIVASGLFLN